MTDLADLTVGALVRGILDRPVRIVQLEWHGSDALTLTYTDESGRPGQELLYRDDEPRLIVEGQGRSWSMDADGHLFRLVSEAKRISLAYLFDSYLAVQISTLDPLPHQIDAIEASRIGNPFAERHLLIARLDHLSRNEDLQARLAATDWDLIMVDEAHKMAAHYFGREVKETKLAYRLYTLGERKKWAKEALAYNALVVSWPEIVRLAAERPMEASGQQTLG